jgi:hypothetical protein
MKFLLDMPVSMALLDVLENFGHREFYLRCG